MSRLLLLLALVGFTQGAAAQYDLLIRNGTVYDGTGSAPYAATVAISGDRIAAIGRLESATAETEIDASGLAVAPGFVNLLSHAHISLLVDGRAMSDVLQGVTLEVLSEISLSPLTDASAQYLGALIDEDVELDWRSVDDYLRKVEAGGVAPNFATFVSAATVRSNVLGLDNVDPNPGQWTRCARRWTRPCATARWGSPRH